MSKHNTVKKWINQSCIDVPNSIIKCIISIIVSLHFTVSRDDVSSDSLAESDSKLRFHEKSDSCLRNSPISCTEPINYYDSGPQSRKSSTPDNTSSVMTPTPSTTTTSSTPTVSNMAGSTSDAELDSTPTAGPTDGVHSGSTNPSGMLGGTDDPSSDGGLVISTTAIAFIAIGGVFFIVLVVLVSILLACLCPRRSARKSFVPTVPPEIGSK